MNVVYKNSALLKEKIMDSPLKTLRKQVRLNAETIADYIKCPLETYLKYENGELEPPVHVLKKLSFYYFTSIDYLLGVTADDAPYPRIYQEEDTL